MCILLLLLLLFSSLLLLLLLVVVVVVAIILNQRHFHPPSEQPLLFKVKMHSGKLVKYMYICYTLWLRTTKDSMSRRAKS
jgi:hypothetical protein